LNGGELTFDPSGTAYANLVIGAHEEVSYSYTVSDGTASATADVDVEYCGAVNTLETIAASLPSTGTISVSDDNSPGGVYYTTTISGTGDDRLDGKSFDIAYCLVQADVLYFEVDTPADIYLADESSIPSGALAKPEHLDLVNWIINQGFENMDNGDGTGATYTEAEIQGAIWGLLDDLNWVPPGTGTRENATEIMELAQADGEGFTPGEGDVVGLFLLPTDAATPEDNDQASIIGVRFEDLAQDCFCL
ncbi:thioester domain-containing protein, partial [Amaricoccus sp. W119]|uniref:thioester domain-containing protein n=1 Tax=Amaricoccus sp. W119 TaxID=3391833 RepID=UPI0039A406B8